MSHGEGWVNHKYSVTATIINEHVSIRINSYALTASLTCAIPDPAAHPKLLITVPFIETIAIPNIGTL